MFGESAEPNPYRVRKFVHVDRWGLPVGFDLSSREQAPWRSLLLVPPKGGFILIGREIARTLGLTSLVTSGVAESHANVGANGLGWPIVCPIIFSLPQKEGFWELAVKCGEGPCRIPEVRIPVWELTDWPRYMTRLKTDGLAEIRNLGKGLMD
ncbi:hypothetical protein B296_00038221 [Ensete ventricosum]|uniref:Uncharacterized protein n=1 Tax=Ensete ventricosum TaxID=4639 RepID=A0A426ZX42_ENSVE|nr:hypothetical protein B296_00038221 [Ensete ventricosum]